jgi:hypothetical protein
MQTTPQPIKTRAASPRRHFSRSDAKDILRLLHDRLGRDVCPPVSGFFITELHTALNSLAFGNLQHLTGDNFMYALTAYFKHNVHQHDMADALTYSIYLASRMKALAASTGQPVQTSPNRKDLRVAKQLASTERDVAVRMYEWAKYVMKPEGLPPYSAQLITDIRTALQTLNVVQLLIRHGGVVLSVLERYAYENNMVLPFAVTTLLLNADND